MGQKTTHRTNYEALRAHFAGYQQDHVFRFWDTLAADARERLLAQAARIDLGELARVQESLGSAQPEAAGALEAIPVERIPEHGGSAARFAEARERGEAILRAGRVAALVVAGGQATRLGFAGPKGAFPLGPVSDRSLFEQQAQKLRRLRSRYRCDIPWYVMTSDATDAPTRALLAEHKYFGLPEQDVFVFRQGMVPSLDFGGRMLLERPDRIFENPNGHGGSLTALLDSGALDDMERRGIDTLFYYQVDNPLVRLADPAYLGFHDAAGADMSCKVIKKRDAAEKVGVVARRDGKIGVVEYTEISDTHRNARDDAGELVYWAGNAAIHVLGTRFVRRTARQAERSLPFHASPKKIPALDADGRPSEPSEPNGHKLERFIFDALPAARAVCVVEAQRSLEYSPVKNATGEDSPETARRDLMACYRSWLEEAEIALPGPDIALEIDHAVVDGPEDAQRLGVASIQEASEVIRQSSGASR